MNPSPEDMARALDAHPDYRVLRRLQPRTSFNPVTEGLPCARGIVLDTETTGLSSETDRVIELGMLLFEFDPTSGLIYRVLDVFDELEDPGFPIPRPTPPFTTSPMPWCKANALMTPRWNACSKECPW
jgi:DNA polymerase-3 subunit epsilon